MLLRLATMRLSALLGVPAVLALSAPALASVLVLPVEGTNLDDGSSAAIGQMLASAYRVESGEDAIGPAAAEKAVAEAGGYTQAAQKLGAKEYIYVTAVRLDARIVITATRYGADGHFIYSSKIAATSLDDVEPASERLARALIRRQSSAEARTLDTVTRSEQSQPLRTSSQKVAGFKGGITYPIGWTRAVAVQMSGAFDLRLESASHFIEVGVGITVPPSNGNLAYGGLWAEIGGSFYLADGSTAPYLGFGVMPRLMSHSIANLAPYLQGGLMMFRDSSTRLYTDLRVAQNVLPVTFRDHGDGLYPTEVTFSVGMGF
jgi:hypothetical protein